MPLTLVNSTTGGAYNTPGPQSVAPGNILGNLLVLFAAWDVSALTTSAAGIVPAGDVSDSSRNWWRLAGDSGSLVPGCRCAVWICANALAISQWLSFCPQGNVSSFEFILAEFSGAPSSYWPLIDFVAVASNKNASSLTPAGTATVSDYCFSVGAIGATAPAITGPGAGWTTIANASQGGANPNPVQLSAAFGAFSAGAVSAAWSYSAGGQVAAVLAGITQANNLPVQINPNFPRVFVEAALGIMPGDPSVAIADNQYTDLSVYAIGPAGQMAISTGRGKAYELSQPEAGVISVAMNNQSGAFNPQNTLSPFYPNIIPGVPLRVSAQFSGRRYPLGAGFVERWPQDWPDFPQWGWSRLVATDGVGVARAANLPSAVQGEILADLPYACFPFSEQYTASQNTLNGITKFASTADGLVALNTAQNNQQPAVYCNGDTTGVVTGTSLGMQGDSGTGMGASAFQSIDITGVGGPGVTYGPDTGLPALAASGAGDATFEIWFAVPAYTLPGSNQHLRLLQISTPPWLGMDGGQHLGGGVLLNIGLLLLAASATPTLFVQSAWSGSDLSGGNVVLTTVQPGGSATTNLHHLAITMSGGTLTAYLDGASVATLAGIPYPLQVYAMVFGPAAWVSSPSGANWNYSLAYGTCYPYALAAGRISSHFSSGSFGFAGDTFVQRAGRMIAWGGLNLGLCGSSASDHLQLAAAYSVGGQALASALDADALSSGGTWGANACGKLVVLPRPFQYDQPTAVTFGDNVAGGEVPYNASVGFDFDNTYIQTSVKVTLTQGANTVAAPLVRSPSAVAKYFQRGPLAQQMNSQSAQDANDRAWWSQNKYQAASLRVRQMKVEPAKNPAIFPSVLATDQYDVAVVNRRPLTQGSYSLPVVLGKITHNIGPGMWETDYEMYPYVPEGTVLATGAGASNVLGSNALAWLCQSTPAPGPTRRSLLSRPIAICTRSSPATTIHRTAYYSTRHRRCTWLTWLQLLLSVSRPYRNLRAVSVVKANGGPQPTTPGYQVPEQIRLVWRRPDNSVLWLAAVQDRDRPEHWSGGTIWSGPSRR